MAEAKELTENEAAEWVRNQFQAANKYLAEQGIIPDKVLTKDSRYLVPLVAVWKFTTQDKKELWVINGDVPTDVVGAKAANTARDVMRHFALQWQLKADQMLNDEKLMADPEQARYAKFMVERAESLYSATREDALWKE